MKLKAREIINAMDSWAESKLIDSWDNTGFQVGEDETTVSRVLISLDMNEAVLEKAIKNDCEMIITHHPIVFKPLKSLTNKTYKERLILNAIKNNIVIYNAHSNLDLAKGGVNDVLANLLHLKNIDSIRKVKVDKLYKFVVYVPESHAQYIREVLGDMGAGSIGNYSHCTFSTKGIGTFLPKQNSNPYIGTAGEIENVVEIKIETIIEEKNLLKTVNEVLKNHPYEEVAYDIYELINQGNVYGYGRVGDIEKIKLEDYLDFVKSSLNVKFLKVYGDIDDKYISRVAVCGGSGSEFIYDAYKESADIYITGDIKYHDAELGTQLGLVLVDAGHYHTEKTILPEIKKYLENEFNNSLIITIYEESSVNCQLY